MAKKKVKLPNSFEKVRAAYDLDTPEQIKMRIIWNHISALIIAVNGQSADNIKKLKYYNNQFLICEAEEKKSNGRST